MRVAGGAVDLAVAADGSIKVAKLFADQVSKVNPGDNSASSSVPVACPTAVETGPGGTALAAEGGIYVGYEEPLEEGRIVRVHF